MRKIKIFSLIFVLIIGLCSCSSGSAEFNVETLKGWSFQFNEGTNDYSLSLAFLTKLGIIFLSMAAWIFGLSMRKMRKSIQLQEIFQKTTLASIPVKLQVSSFSLMFVSRLLKLKKADLPAGKCF